MLELFYRTALYLVILVIPAQASLKKNKLISPPLSRKTHISYTRPHLKRVVSSTPLRSTMRKSEISRSLSSKEKKVAYITAIIGSYEQSCKKVAPQTTPVDQYCFTNLDSIHTDGNWQVVRTPHHIENPSTLDTGNQHNSLRNNSSTFNIAKYYKQQWHLIPELQNYDMVVWLDGTVEIVNEKTTDILLDILFNQGHTLATWEHEWRGGCLACEVDASNGGRYEGQDVRGQYQAYLDDGYSDEYWKKIDSRDHFGVWVTCMIAFKNNKTTHKFLDHWYTQTLKYTTQDQVSFPYSLFKNKLVPYTFPKDGVNGGGHTHSNIHIKHRHGQ